MNGGRAGGVMQTKGARHRRLVELYTHVTIRRPSGRFLTLLCCRGFVGAPGGDGGLLAHQLCPVHAAIACSMHDPMRAEHDKCSMVRKFPCAGLA